MPTSKNSIAVVGLGYVGLPLALLAESKGYRVFGLDTNKERIAKLSKRESPIADVSLSKDLKKAKRIEFTTDFSVIKQASTIVVCVPTPVYKNYMPNLEPVKNACISIAKFLKKGQLVVIESTINPGVCDEVVLPLLEKISGLKGGKDFYLAHCPERINPGDKKWTVKNIPRVVGALEKKGLDKAVAFYSDIIDAEIRPMGSLKEAEAVKIVENSFRDINIAFVNELAMSFAKLGIDVVNVIHGAATKPFAFMAHYPSCGVGGHCIPVDPYYLIEYAKKNGFQHDFLKLARHINNGMPQFTVDQLILGLNQVKASVKGAKITILGLAYKANIEDTRESPAYEIIHILKDLGAQVTVFDPNVLHESTVKTLDEALVGREAVIIASAHREFKALTPQVFKKKGVKVVIDGCNCLPKGDFIASKLVYKGIGR
jgi:UDP-N-acetyl-D-glucosamine dehydrogenase